MRIVLNLDLATEAFAADARDEMTALLERVGELVAECQSTGEDVAADLFDSDSDRVGHIRVTA